jgi:hypothetical protein
MRGSTVLSLSVKLVFPGQCIGAVTFIMSGSWPNDKCEMVLKLIQDIPSVSHYV